MLSATSACAILFAAAPPRSINDFAHRIFHVDSPELFRSSPSGRLGKLPPVTFWAWERPEDLRFLLSNQAGVAFLVKTIYLQSHSPDSSESSPSFVVRPRLQPLRISPGTPLTAVVRLESSHGLPREAFFKNTPTITPLHPEVSRDQQAPALDPSSSVIFQRVAAEISDLQNIPSVQAIQIDFDAAISERPFYAALLSEVRRRLPPSMPLSITALASWCIGDPWLEKLPAGTIDEAVPMLFRLGPDAQDIVKFLRSGKEFPVTSCRGSLGLSTDEPLSRDVLSGAFRGASPALRQKRVYVFSPRAQTQSAAQSVLEEWHP